MMSEIGCAFLLFYSTLLGRYVGLVFVRLSKVNASVIIPVLVMDHCVGLHFGVVQRNSPICVSDNF
jgi:hypothetical protein